MDVAGAQILLTVSGLILVALAAAAAGERVGAPLLLVFLAVGVLAGAEGPGGILIENPDLAFTAASAALAVILVDGGLRTRPETLEAGFRPGLTLATAGTLITAGLTAIAAAYAFGIGWREALLVGAVVSSTDAAAVFAVIGGSAAKVRQRLAATLETESGLNDPAAVFLTLSLAGALAGTSDAGPLDFALNFLWQAAMGAAIGAGGGFALARATPRLRLAPGLRPILVLAGGLFAFATAQAVGASGFLAAYVCGIAHARRDRGVVEAEARALDGFAWLAQLALFLILGLLAQPSHIAAVAVPAIAVALALTFIARPAAVFLSLAPFKFSLGERLFASWAGLRGATPIFLGLAPAALGAPNASLYFSAAFVAVGVSLIAQGWTTPFAARALGVSGEEAEQGAAGAVALPAKLRDIKLDRFKPGGFKLDGVLAISPVRGAAIAIAVAAALSAALVVIRLAAPAPETVWTPASVAEMEMRLAENAAARATRLPPDWVEADLARRQALFVAALTPLVEAENARIAALRAEVQAFADAEARGQPLSFAAQARRDVLAREYGVRYEDLPELLARLDAVPVRLAVAQSALVTNWGAAAGAVENNALFGRRPSGEGESRFDDLSSSIEEYLYTLNTHRQFESFRETRAVVRELGLTPRAEDLVDYIGAFAGEPDIFVERVREMLATVDAAEDARRELGG
jgi:cell volume regulation protein A